MRYGCLVVAVLLAWFRTAHSEPTPPTALPFDEYETDACEIRIVRKADTRVVGIEPFCSDKDKWNKPGARDMARLHLWALPILGFAYDMAEISMCGKQGCVLGGKKPQVRILIVGDGFPFVQTKRNINSDSVLTGVDIAVSTGFIDFIDNTAAALHHNTLEQWLAMMPGRDCKKNMPSSHQPNDSVDAMTGPIQQLASTMYVFVMAHELAHIQRTDCRAAEAKGVESQCDRIALTTMSKIRTKVTTGSSPGFVLIVYVILDHFLTWQVEVFKQRKSFGLVDEFPPLKWGERARSLASEWGVRCNGKEESDLSNAVCYAHTRLQTAVKSLLDLALPAACPKSSVSPTALESIRAGEGNPSAKRCIRVIETQNQRVKWNTSPNNPIVDIDLTYSNVCKVDVQCKLVFASGTTNRKTPGDENWKPYAYASESLLFQGGNELRFARTLAWMATPDVMPSVQYPDPPDRSMNLLSCNFINDADEKRTFVENGTADFCATLQKAVAAAPEFTSLKGGVNQLDSEETKPTSFHARLAFGANHCSIDAGDDPTLRCDVGRSSSSFASTVKDAATCLGAKWTRTEEHGSTSSSAYQTVRFVDPKEAVEVTVDLWTSKDPKRQPRASINISRK